MARWDPLGTINCSSRLSVLRPRAFGRRAVALPTATLPAPFQGAPHASQIQEEAQSSSEAELCATADGRLTPHPALPRLRDRHPLPRERARNVGGEGLWFSLGPNLRGLVQQ